MVIFIKYDILKKIMKPPKFMNYIYNFVKSLNFTRTPMYLALASPLVSMCAAGAPMCRTFFCMESTHSLRREIRSSRWYSRSAAQSTTCCSAGRIVSWIIYCWLVWCERIRLEIYDRLRASEQPVCRCIAESAEPL